MTNDSTDTAEDMAAYNTFLMGENIFIVISQILSITGNGFISYLFLKRNRLRKIHGLQMLWMLSITDLVFAIAVFPYMIYYIAYWHPDRLDYDGILVVKLSLPLTLQYKITLIISLGIALDRCQALFFSTRYRQRQSNKSYVASTILIGVGWGTFDCILELSMDPVQHNPGCAAVGCFNSLDYRRYWGTSNMLLSLVMLLLTLVLGVKLKMITSANTNAILVKSSNERGQRQANRLTMAVIIISVIFHAIPSSLVGVADYFGVNLFAKLGPFYIVGLLLGGVCNSIVYITLHNELRMATINTFTRQKEVATSMLTNSKSQITRIPTMTAT
ncbi:unnamed protein product [Bursaphelenchus xylophilus]|uniref:(pine wood nematode) hypothetical protein n=1 Tax=Bursaphelenchus xylophilus TaxID=6326 RepID=A0A1I7SAR3_BURXY|nr:unnamed protein product [Bursaphelenchus xylophilus]CAG9126865.1 unnamed protein product [Bursaphelenchus xylophilus]